MDSMNRKWVGRLDLTGQNIKNIMSNKWAHGRLCNDKTARTQLDDLISSTYRRKSVPCLLCNLCSCLRYLEHTQSLPTCPTQGTSPAGQNRAFSETCSEQSAVSTHRRRQRRLVYNIPRYSRYSHYCSLPTWLGTVGTGQSFSSSWPWPLSLSPPLFMSYLTFPTYLALPAKPSGSSDPPSFLPPLAANQHLTTALHRNSTSSSPLHASELHRYHLFQVDSRTRTAPIFDATRQIARPFEPTLPFTSVQFSTSSRRPGQHQTSAIASRRLQILTQLDHFIAITTT